jgi:hypothetical protein
VLKSGSFFSAFPKSLHIVFVSFTSIVTISIALTIVSFLIELKKISDSKNFRVLLFSFFPEKSSEFSALVKALDGSLTPSQSRGAASARRRGRKRATPRRGEFMIRDSANSS